MPWPLLTLLLSKHTIVHCVVIPATNSSGKHHYVLMQLAAMWWLGLHGCSIKSVDIGGWTCARPIPIHLSAWPTNKKQVQKVLEDFFNSALKMERFACIALGSDVDYGTFDLQRISWMYAHWNQAWSFFPGLKMY